MKAEMGCMRKGLVIASISVEKSPNVQKTHEQFVNGKQKNKFAGTAKKNQSSKIHKRSLVRVEHGDAVSDSDDDPQPEYGSGHMGAMTILVKPKKKHVSPRLMNAMLVGIARRILSSAGPVSVMRPLTEYRKAMRSTTECRSTGDCKMICLEKNLSTRPWSPGPEM